MPIAATAYPMTSVHDGLCRNSQKSMMAKISMTSQCRHPEQCPMSGGQSPWESISDRKLSPQLAETEMEKHEKGEESINSIAVIWGRRIAEKK